MTYLYIYISSSSSTLLPGGRCVDLDRQKKTIFSSRFYHIAASGATATAVVCSSGTDRYVLSRELIFFFFSFSFCARYIASHII